MKVTLHRFGRNRRLVLILEWLTLWPTSGPLAVSSQRRDIAKSSFVPGLESLGGSNSRPFQEPRTYRGRAASRQGRRPDFAPAPPPGKTGLARSSIGLSGHISGAIAAEIILPRISRSEAADLFKKRADPLFAGHFCLNEQPIAPTSGSPLSDHAQHDFALAGRAGAAGVEQPVRRHIRVAGSAVGLRPGQARCAL